MSHPPKIPILLLFLVILFPLTGNPTIQEVYIQGEDYRQTGDYYRAIESYKTALQMNSSFLGPLKGLAGCYFALGEYQEALHWIEEALHYDMKDVDLMNLEGRILLGLGRFREAEGFFSRVLDNEPNNIDAQFGMAELEIAFGKIQNAAGRYRNALRISPENRRALLSLVLLYDKSGDPEVAEEYIEQALYYYSDNPQVRYIAGYHYSTLGRIDDALHHASAALALDNNYFDAGILFSQLAMKTGDSDKAVEVLSTFLRENRDQPLLWYSLGTAYRNERRIEEAIQAYAAASLLRSGDDMSRIALENLLMNELDLDDPRRGRYADYHFDLGREYDDRNLIKRAFQEFRRGLQIEPYSSQGRLLLGDIHRRNGFLSLYWEELTILADMLEEPDIDIQDELEFLENKLEESVSQTWGIDQFYQEREDLKIGLFYMNSRMYHQGGEEDLLIYIKQVLMGYENIDILEVPGRVDSFAQAYRQARAGDSDYFVILDIEESERIISFNNRIYLSETGGELKRWSIFRTGNQRIPDAAQKAAQDIKNLMPLSGRLINRSFDQGLISLGAVDGLSIEQKFMVIRNGELSLSKDGFGFTFDDDSVLGTFTVTGLDDLVCDGILEKKYFFDMINQGDYIIPVIPDPEVEEGDEETVSSEESEYELGLPPDIYDSLLRIQ